MNALDSLNFSSLPESGVWNTTERAEYQEKSRFHRFTHFREGRQLHKAFYQTLIGKLDEVYQIGDVQRTDRIFRKICTNQGIGWSKSKTLTTETLQKIKTAFDKTLLYNGKGVQCREEYPPALRDACHYLFCMHDEVPEELVNGSNVRKILWRPDSAFSTAFRNELEGVMKSALEARQEAQYDSTLFAAFIHNIVGLLPFSYPQEGETIQIPVQKGENWEMATYTVDKKFALSPSWFSSPLPAYGLTSENGPPMLIFLGTTYPAGEGFAATLFSDFTPGLSVGHAPFLYGKEEIAEWLGGKENVSVSGISLGGALSLHAARYFPQVSEVYAFNPAGHYPWNGQKFGGKGPNIHIYSQKNDLVSTMGFFPEGENVEVYRVLGTEDEPFFKAHARSYFGADQVSLLKSSPEFENSRIERRILTGLHMIGSSIVFLLVLPFHLIFRLIQLIEGAISSCFCSEQDSEVLPQTT
ncbi:MAG: hypothetical protein K940chlam9_01699 [Chlamydiae bacterium]|nr:hypothetical protein [Chlamydiota bacterium]